MVRWYVSKRSSDRRVLTYWRETRMFISIPPDFWFFHTIFLCTSGARVLITMGNTQIRVLWTQSSMTTNSNFIFVCFLWFEQNFISRSRCSLTCFLSWSLFYRSIFSLYCAWCQWQIHEQVNSTYKSPSIEMTKIETHTFLFDRLTEMSSE